MKIAFLLLAQAMADGGVAMPPPVAPGPAAAPQPVAPRPVPIQPPMPPADWSHLPQLPLTRRLPDARALSDFVRAEVAAGRCAAASVAGSGYVLPVDMAVLVTASGTIRRIVPRAIGCVTVEQYASGLVSRLARGGIARHSGADAWYRTTMTFAWDR